MGPTDVPNERGIYEVFISIDLKVIMTIEIIVSSKRESKHGRCTITDLTRDRDDRVDERY